MDLAALAALIYLAATLVTVGFQVALALGAPWGEFTMGGAVRGRLPPAMRLIALVQAAVLSVLALIVLTHAGVIPVDILAQGWLIWIVVAVGVVSLVMNAASRSPRERRLWVPVIIITLASSIVVALTT